MSQDDAKTKAAADLASDAYGLTTGAMYELLKKGAAGDLKAVKVLGGMGMVVGSAMDVVKFIDAASRDDVRAQITSVCSIGGGIAGGAVGGVVGGGVFSPAVSVVLGTLGSKGGETLCGELYDQYKEWIKNPQNRKADTQMYEPAERNDLSFSSRAPTNPLTSEHFAKNEAVDIYKNNVLNKTTVAVNNLCDSVGFNDSKIRGNLSHGMTCAALENNFAGKGTYSASLNGNNINLIEELSVGNRNYAAADSKEMGNIDQSVYQAKIADFTPSDKTLGINVDQAPTVNRSQSV